MGADPKCVTFLRWMKFNAVGGIGIGVQLLVLFALKTVFRLDYLAATALAVETAVIHNFLWHERFTWPDRSSNHSLARFLRFNLTNGLFSIGGNLLVMKALVGSGHLNYLIANTVAISVCSLLNFLASDKFVFQSEAR